MKIKGINIFTENIYPDWEVDELKVISVGRRIVKYFLKHLLEKSCLNVYDFDSLTFDILFCDSYAADIITFAIFADDDAKFILDEDINLGEIILALDKVKEEAQKHNVTDEYELYFLIAHGILHLLGFDHQTEEDYNFVVSEQNKALEYALGEKE